MTKENVKKDNSQESNKPNKTVIGDKFDAVGGREQMAKRALNFEINPLYKYLLAWGYIATVALVVQFFSLITATAAGAPKSWIIWLVAGVLGFLVTAKFVSSDRKRRNFENYSDNRLSIIWGGYILTLILVFVLWGYDYQGLIYQMAGVVFVYGLYMTTRIVGERWLYMGVAACAVFVVAFKFVDHQYYTLIMAAIVILGNIMPIHILLSDEVNRYIDESEPSEGEPETEAIEE